ncbi:serine/threonine-protein kinase [Elioraea thermophila]|uniref:hypothetical protein n=1 Tax=Elioraea thermophila TaxID=2185104 RepID=UPI000DF2EF98|nr:hypothetical protein [Elioraea thermophila]
MANERLEIGGFTADPQAPVAGFAPAGLPCFRALGADGTQVVAVLCRNEHPARLRAILRLIDEPDLPGLLRPLAQDVVVWSGSALRAVVYEAPPGPALLRPGQRAEPMREGDLIQNVVRPIGRALLTLGDLGLTHRGIRPDNLFRAGNGPVLLGDGFCTPPALAQPAAFEDPATAVCLPAGRGEGTIADDLYALGVTLVALAMGEWPLAGRDDAAVIRAKLEHGNLVAVVGENRLPGGIATLVRGLLAEDPARRPQPAELAGWPGTAKVRPVSARPLPRASRGLRIGKVEVRDLRSLAFALGRNWSEGAEALRSGAVAVWVERGLGQPVLAARLRELTGPLPRGDEPFDGTMCRAIAALDPHAPLFWQGKALMPDGIGAVLAETLLAPSPSGLPLAALDALIGDMVIARWASVPGERPHDAMALDRAARRYRLVWRNANLGSGPERLLYALNPALPCLSPLIAGEAAGTVPAALAALERRAGGLARGTLPIDRHLAAFIAVHMDGRLDDALAAVGAATTPAEAAVAAMAVFAQLQTTHRSAPMPALAGLLADLAMPALAQWRERARRERATAEAAAVAASGDLARLHALFADPQARARDSIAFAQARREAQEAAQAIARLRHDRAAREAEARRLGARLSHATGLVVLALTLLSLSGV